MPPKIRELISDLERAGFVNQGGKGSHRKFVHPKVADTVVISGQTGDDARPYRVRDVKMKDSARYVKIVEWSEEDQCYVGRAPGLVLGGCHGDDEKQVFAQLCDIVDEVVEMIKADSRPLPPPTIGKDDEKAPPLAA